MIRATFIVGWTRSNFKRSSIGYRRSRKTFSNGRDYGWGRKCSSNSYSEMYFWKVPFLILVIIAGVARKFGLFSDSSQRYERGVDPYLQMKALERATHLSYLLSVDRLVQL